MSLRALSSHSRRSGSSKAWSLTLVSLVFAIGIVAASGAIAAGPSAGSRRGASPAVQDSDGTDVDDLGTASPGASPVPNPIAAAIDRLLDGEQGVFGVVLMQPDGTLLYSRNSNTPFVSASLYKLVLMADICRAVDDGLLALDTPLYVAEEYYSEIDGTDSYFDPSYAGYDTTIEEALYATGAFSSNVAAKALLTLTSPEDLNATAAELGLTGTFLFTDPASTPDWPPSAGDDSSDADIATAEAFVMSYATDGQVNLTTPLDMARYFELLLKGEVFNERVSAMILDVLKHQVVDNRFPTLLPEDTELAHKTGNLDLVVHDVGVIYSPNGPMILAAMVQAPASDERATEIVQRLALIAYGTLEVPPLPATPTGDGTGVEEAEPATPGTPIAVGSPTASS